MPADRLIPTDVRSQLDELPLSALWEYMCRRLGQGHGQRALEVRFENGRYERTYVRTRLAETEQ
jgi:hypothetical protein